MGTGMLAVIATAVAALAPNASAAPSTLMLGASDNAFYGGSPDLFWADIEALRPQVFRVNATWARIAPTKPTQPANPGDPAYDWSSIDGLVAGLAQRGVTPLITVYGTPRWAGLTSSTCTPPPDKPFYCTRRAPNATKFAKFVTAIATRYSGAYTPAGAGAPLPRVTLWELWNESNNRNFLTDANGKPVPAFYGTMLRRGAAAVRAVATAGGFKSTVIAFGVGGRIGATHAGFMRAVAKSPACRAAGGKACFDAVSYHAYPKLPARGVDDGTAFPYFSTQNVDGFVQFVSQTWPTRRRMPIYITEFGWQTKTSPSDSAGVTPAQQALFMSQAVARFRAQPRIKAAIWWLLRDEADPGAWQSGFRTLNNHFKPSFDAFRGLTTP